MEDLRKELIIEIFKEFIEEKELETDFEAWYADQDYSLPIEDFK